MIIRNLTFKYRKKLIFENLNLELYKGLYVLKGPSGSGKSTFFYLLKGVIPKIKHTYQISLMSQEIFLEDKSRILDNLLYISKDIKEIRRYLSFFSLTEDQKIKELSLGQKQIVSFIQTLLKKADIYLFDEPTSNLDYQNEQKVYKILKELSKNTCVIFSSHKQVNFGKTLYIENNTIIKKNKEKGKCINNIKAKYKITLSNMKSTFLLYLMLVITLNLISNIAFEKDINQKYVFNDCEIENKTLYTQKKQQLYNYSIKGINNYVNGVVINDITHQKFQIEKNDYIYDEFDKYRVIDIVNDNNVTATIYFSSLGKEIEIVDPLADIKKNIYNLKQLLIITTFICYFIFLLLIIEKNIKQYLKIDILFNSTSLKLTIFCENLITSLLLIQYPTLQVLNMFSGFFLYYYIKKREISLLRDNI